MLFAESINIECGGVEYAESISVASVLVADSCHLLVSGGTRM